MKRLLTFLALTCAAVASYGATLVPVQLLNPTGSTSGKAIISTGASTAPTWGNVAATALAAQAANTVVANVTGASASPTAASVPNCVGTSSALTYTAGSGFGCNASINALTLGGASFAAPGPIGSTSTSSGAFSSISAPSATIGGGTINNTTIGATAASTGKFTTLQATSTITPSTTAGIIGTSAGDNANAGSVGEVISSSLPIGSAVALTSGTAANITSISLTAGDWDVWGNIATNPAGTTTQSLTIASINTVSGAQATLPDGGAMIVLPFAAGGGSGIAASVGMTRINVASTTTVFLVITSSFATSTNAAYGFIGARRRR